MGVWGLGVTFASCNIKMVKVGKKRLIHNFTKKAPIVSMGSLYSFSKKVTTLNKASQPNPRYSFCRSFKIKPFVIINDWLSIQLTTGQRACKRLFMLFVTALGYQTRDLCSSTQVSDFLPSLCVSYVHSQAWLEQCCRNLTNFQIR